MPYADHGDVSLYYERTGSVGQDAVVFVEGLGYGMWMWRWQRDRLADDFETIVCDNRGTGASDAPPGPYTIAQMAGDLEAVLDDAGVDAAHVVGASMGGMIALQHAVDFDRTLTLALLCTTHGGPDAVPVPEETQARMFDVPEGFDEREAIRYKMRPALSEGFYESHADLIEHIVDWRLATDAPDHAREAQAAAVAEFDAFDAVADVDVPALVMHGTGDRVVPVENGRMLADALPNATLELVEGGSHLFFIEQSDEVTDRLRAFIEDHAGT